MSDYDGQREHNTGAGDRCEAAGLGNNNEDVSDLRIQKRSNYVVDKTSVDYDNYIRRRLPVDIMEILTCNFDTAQECIGLWLNALEKGGFTGFTSCMVGDYGGCQDDNNSNQNKQQRPGGRRSRRRPETFIEDSDLWTVEDPFGEISEDQVERYEREDGAAPGVGLRGYCTAYIKEGYELSGRWKNGKRMGRGLIAGRALEANGIQVIWGTYKNGLLQGPGKVELLGQNCTLEGNFVNGKLHGAVRGLTAKGRLAWAGLFKAGHPHGACWKTLEGGGFLYGQVGQKGRFEGPKNAYIYPDLETCMRGTFADNTMVSAMPVKIADAFIEKTGAIMRLRFTMPRPHAPIFKYWPSTRTEVLVPPLFQDPFENKFVWSGPSKMSEGSGDGLFLKIDVKANTTVSFYNGIRVRPEDEAPYHSTGYQIFVDDVLTNQKKGDRSSLIASTVDSDYMDIPPEFVSLRRYRASLGHKINHSFAPNCRFSTIQHPTFGRVPRVVTLVDLPAGTELSVHYCIDMGEAAQDIEHLKWYLDLWDEFSLRKSKDDQEQEEPDKVKVRKTKARKNRSSVQF